MMDEKGLVEGESCGFDPAFSLLWAVALRDSAPWIFISNNLYEFPMVWWLLVSTAFCTSSGLS